MSLCLTPRSPWIAIHVLDVAWCGIGNVLRLFIRMAWTMRLRVPCAISKDLCTWVVEEKISRCAPSKQNIQMRSLATPPPHRTQWRPCSSWKAQALDWNLDKTHISLQNASDIPTCKTRGEGYHHTSINKLILHLLASSNTNHYHKQIIADCIT